jgi:hypothetical protein
MFIELSGGSGANGRSDGLRKLPIEQAVGCMLLSAKQLVAHFLCYNELLERSASAEEPFLLQFWFSSGLSD